MHDRTVVQGLKTLETGMLPAFWHFMAAFGLTKNEEYDMMYQRKSL